MPPESVNILVQFVKNLLVLDVKGGRKQRFFLVREDSFRTVLPDSAAPFEHEGHALDFPLIIDYTVFIENTGNPERECR